MTAAGGATATTTSASFPIVRHEREIVIGPEQETRRSLFGRKRWTNRARRQEPRAAVVGRKTGDAMSSHFLCCLVVDVGCFTDMTETGALDRYRSLSVH